MRTCVMVLLLLVLAVPAWGQSRQKQPPNASPQANSQDQPSTSKKGSKQPPAGKEAGQRGGKLDRRETPGESAAPADQAPPSGLQAAPDEGKLVPLGGQAIQGAEAFISQACVLPPEAHIEGQPLKLMDLAARIASRPQQQQAIEAYWQLAAAVARYTFRWDDYAQLEQLLPSAVELDRDTRRGVDPALESQLSAAQARLREAEAAVLAAQYRLVEAASLPANPLPLPADVPHVGPYNTKFQTLFASRPAPAQARMLDRLLPLRKRAIDVRAAAIQAALDAVDSCFESGDGSADLVVVLRLLEDLARQRQAFIDAVLAYNSEIATYALAVAPPNTAPQQLVGMLIKLPGNSRRPASMANQPDDINRTNFEQPLEGDGPSLGTAGQPAPADPATQEGPVQGEPTPADPATRPREDDQPEPADESQYLPANNDARLLVLAGPTVVQASHPAYDVPFARQPGRRPAFHMAAFRQQVDEGLYPALRGVRPARRAQQLAEVLHWLAIHGELEGEPLSLVACLTQTAKSGQAASARRELLAAYWTAQESAARLAVLAQQVEQLSALRHEAISLVTSGRAVPSGAPVLSLWAAEQAAKADVCDARAAWAVAQFALTQRLARTERPAWYIPSTAPHAGSYRLKLESQPASISQRPDVQRLVRAIPTLHTVIVDQASAVVAADAHRAATAPNAFEESLAATRRLTAESLAFLGSVSDYNQKIAEYALTVVGADAPADRLAAALVLPRAINAN